MKIYLDSNAIDYLKEQFITAEVLIKILEKQNVYLCFSSTTLSEPARMFLLEDRNKANKGTKLFNFIKHLLPRIILVKENGLLLREEQKKHNNKEYSYFCNDKESDEVIKKIKLLAGDKMPEDGKKAIQTWVENTRKDSKKMITDNAINKGLKFNNDFTVCYTEALRFLNVNNDYILKDAIDKRTFDLVIANKSSASPIFICFLSVLYLNYHAIEHGEIAKDKNFDLMHIVASSVCDKMFSLEHKNIKTMIETLERVTGKNNLIGPNEFNRILGV